MDWHDIAQENRKVTAHIFAAMQPAIDRVAQVMITQLRAGHKILACGNGGSAADAQHFAGELVNRFLMDSRPFAALALTTDSSILTSICNDYSAEVVFSKQVEGLGRPGDVLLGISTSGNSVNVIKAVDVARERGIITVGLLGGTGGALQHKVDHPLTVSSTAHTPRIQEGHILIIHALCQIIEEALSA